MRFIHYTNAKNLKSILSKGILPPSQYPCIGCDGKKERYDLIPQNATGLNGDSMKSDQPCVFADILYEDYKARYNGWLQVLWSKDQNLENAESVAGIVFTLPPDGMILVGAWGWPDIDMTRISVSGFQNLVSLSLQQIQSKWSEPINTYDFLLCELWDWDDVKRTSKLGRVIHYFQKISVAIVALEEDLSFGDKLEFVGQTTKNVTIVNSMQINNRVVKSASKGDKVGISVPMRVRKNDMVHKIIYEWKNPYRKMDGLHHSFLSSGFEVRIPYAVSPDMILGHRLFCSIAQIDEPWYYENMY